jgi:putative ABC transport system permease protein
MALPLTYNVRSVAVRWTVAALAVVSIALVVGVVAVLLAMSQGFATALRGTGRTDNAMIVGRGSNAETTSRVSLEHRNAILDHVASTNPAAPSARLVGLGLGDGAAQVRREAHERGASALSRHPRSRVRGGIHVSEGRSFTPGLDEVIVGRRILERARGLQLGGTLRYRRRQLRIVGVFESEGGAFESEIWDRLRAC